MRNVALGSEGAVATAKVISESSVNASRSAARGRGGRQQSHSRNMNAGQPPRRRRVARASLPALAMAGAARRERERREERYAASKWGAAPAAAALPPPPTHWRRDGRCRPEPAIDRAIPLKLLLNVTA